VNQELRQVHLRRATSADVPLLRRWDDQPHVIAATGAGSGSDWNWEYELARDVTWRELLIGEVDGRPVGVMQIIDPLTEETHYWGGIEGGLRAIDIWIGEEDDLGEGYGTRMMRLALDRCFSDTAVHAVLVDPLASNTRAHRFYERLGFHRVDRRMFGDDDCCVHRLERSTWEAGKVARE
jgi:aminoglycoside 6'-N-acetyltransferase